MLAYLFTWDPSRFIFTVPFIDRPIGWYGLLFALGFIVGYFIIVRMFRRELTLDNAFTPAHVKDWPALITRLRRAAEDSRDHLHHVAKALKLPKSTVAAVSPQEQQTICQALQCAFERDQLTVILPNIIYPVGDLAFGLTDKLCWFVVGGTVIGARLGHVFFYGWEYYRENLSEIPKVWEGGLASHGGIIGVVIAIYLYNQFARRVLPSLNMVRTLDLVAVPGVFVGFCIRLGNFFNQEIVGVETSVPWAILFAHPAEGGPIVPRHPVQLYEGIVNLLLFFLFLRIWQRRVYRTWPGVLVGLLFTFVFASRFFIEFVKESQGGFADDALLQTGQLLSLPFVAIGLWLLWHGRPKALEATAQSVVS